MTNVVKTFNNGLPVHQNTPLSAPWYLSDDVHQ